MITTVPSSKHARRHPFHFQDTFWTTRTKRTIKGNQMKNIYPTAFLFILFIVIVLWSATVSATPPLPALVPERHMDAYLVFPAGRSPDAQGEFVIEVHCKSYSMQKMVAIKLGYSEEILLDAAGVTGTQQPYHLFQGKMEKGEIKTWRLRGVIANNAIYEGKEMPASIALYIDYPCPPESKQEATILGIKINNELLDNRQSSKYTDKKVIDKRCHIVRALPVWSSEENRKQSIEE